ncbi:MAG: hypothetical protein KC415_22180 [Anaerolineales bacterium]|nr:hypothetical protein [Anaerolineales bacterium]
MKKSKQFVGLLMLLLVLLVMGQAIPNKQLQAEGEGVMETAVCALPASGYTTYLPLVNTNGAAPETPLPMARELQYEVGKTYAYQYEMTSYSVFGTADAENGVSAQTPNVVLSYGMAQISITGQEPGGIFVGQIVLDNPVVCIQNGPGAADDEFVNDEEAIADLQTPLIFRQHKNGVIVDLQMADAVDPVTANQLKSILNSLQATLSEDDDYPAVENGGQGSYVAHYTAVLQQKGLQLTRTFDENSFLSFNSQGDAPAIELDSAVHSFLDRDLGVITRVSFAENDAILGGPDNIDPHEIEGVAMWGQAESRGVLRLTAVTDTPAALISPAAALNYAAADMNAAFDDLREPTHGIDISAIDLNAELDALEANPANLAQFQRLTWILAADAAEEGTAVLDAIADRLVNHLGEEDTAVAYIDLLGHDASPAAQTHLLTLIDPASGVSGSVPQRLKDQTIINLALVAKPQPNTLSVITAIQNDPAGSPHAQNMANAALGAMVPALMNCNPDAAAAIYADLEAQLAVAATEQEQYQLLLALGNTESPALLTLVQPYLNSPNAKVQWAAYWALRDVPGQAAEDILLGVFDDGGLDPGYPLPPAAITLKNRPGKPSDNLIDTLAAYYGDENPFPIPQGGLFDKKWNYEIGNSRIGGSFPGQLVWKSPPYSEHLEALAMQSVDYHLNLPKFDYHHNGTLAQAAAFTNPKAGNDALQEFGYTYSILGKSFNAEYTVPCADGDNGTIASGFREIVRYNFEYKLWGLITVGTAIEATAAYGIDYTYSWDVCAPANMSAEVNLIPHGKILGSIDGHLTILKVTGGIELQATVIDVEVPGALWATYTLQDDFEACAHIPINWEAMNMKLYLFVDVGKWRVHESLVWNDVLSSGSADLIPETCWIP